MQVGSLIFLAIVATWAAYLLQHWIRRREEAAATRTIDRYSEEMRLLEKRAQPETTVAAVATAMARPLTARRGGDRQSPQTGHDPEPARSIAAEGALMSSSPMTRPDPMPRHDGSADPARRPAPGVPPAPGVRPAAHAGVPARAGAPTVPQAGAPRQARVAAPTVSRWRRMLRGVLLLLSLLWVPVSIVLALLHILLWVSVALAVLTVAAVLVWLRLEVRGDRARAAQARAESRSGARRSGGSSERRVPSTSSRRGPSTEAHGTSSSADRVAARRAVAMSTADNTEVIHLPHAAPAAPTPAAARSVPAASASAPATPAEPATAGGQRRQEASAAAYDIEAELARDAADAPAPQPAPEGTWSPVPVPPPTYTMKAKAEPRMTASGVPADVFATPEFAEEAEELDERAQFARRAAGV